MRTKIQKWRVIQILIGLTILGLSALVIMLAWGGKTVEETDITPIFLLVPFGLYLIFVNKKVID